ncbi:triose-phosphate isomerase [Blastopirellula sp. JC732]|uniref:Triosephosphate isomerase n=1 Tax=Blastopirellula sediminis TaxID=2894196 RepID=A0A9X1MKR6_9BACT|nr:triose-phosphate isomerase [Blastopirellula sediminis]MCC9609188.1 triose-phosphate isomerase [Blastopirellula sediminis]MCC9628035.1 triose-phosphate isomerase [Blastopirellula sediminis]
MRRPFIAGNWKMNSTRAEGIALVQGIAAGLPADCSVEVAVCPPSIYLDAIVTAAGDSPIGVGGQNIYFEASGAFTGEVSAAMLKDVGCQYVILGHSERRHIFGESSSLINKKVHAALNGGLIPIVCVGELLEERESNKTADVVAEQFYGSLAGVSAEQMETVVLAYEPVWAIGTGKVATPEQAEAVHADLRKVIAARYNSAVADKVRIQYGGSVKPDNASELLSQPNIDGALVGGASMKADSFLGIIAGAK